jgi:hypothetical protein
MRKYKEFPLIVQTLSFEESSEYVNDKAIDVLIRNVLEAELGKDNPKINAIVKVGIRKAKELNINSKFYYNGVYSYGYFHEPWVNN